MYYCPSENRFKAGRPSATAVKNIYFGIINLHTFVGYFTLRESGLMR
jgi:hypothetical protein